MRQSNNRCFGCGDANPIGLHMQFQQDGDFLCSEVVVGSEYEGYQGVVHGGIVSTLLDEIMANHLYALGYTVMTAELQVRFIHPVPAGETIRLSSRIRTINRHNLYEAEAWATLPDGRVAARGQAKMLPLK
ncbi:MAG: PaaI family thioesterase [Clostridia bacterium]|nr:MAG: PaaI family thioesterase [Clostridia bacterium]